MGSNKGWKQLFNAYFAKSNHSLFTNFMQGLSGNIFATGCRSHMGVSPLVLELKLWHLIFLHLGHTDYILRMTDPDRPFYIMSEGKK